MPDIADATRTILIVERSETTRRILEHTFVAEGFAALGLASAQEALHTLKSIVPDAVIIDALLPDASGTAVGRAMRSQWALKSVPVVMISGHPEERAAVEAATGSYDAIFDKPFSLKKMVQTVRNLIATGSANGAL
jgi:DNA-binding response OmpR family regulator